MRSYSDDMFQNLVLSRMTRLHTDDAVSAPLWAEELQKDDSALFVKFCEQPPPADSGLDDDVLILVLQTPWQREQWEKHGQYFLGIDATHNTTQYQSTSLFTLMARNDWGRGSF
jgi:hypothetical protein